MPNQSLSMATPPTKAVSNTNTTADLTALQLAANNRFIDQTSLVIAQQTAEGKFLAYVTTFENCDINALVQYFNGLGYGVSFPDTFKTTGTQGQAAQLFGPALQAFWQNGGLPPNLTNPTRLAISWQ